MVHVLHRAAGFDIIRNSHVAVWSNWFLIWQESPANSLLGGYGFQRSILKFSPQVYMDVALIRLSYLSTSTKCSVNALTSH